MKTFIAFCWLLFVPSFALASSLGSAPASYPPNFKGESWSAVLLRAKKLAKLVPPQGPYEKSSDYQMRLDALNQSIGAEFQYVVWGKGIKETYDPDQGYFRWRAAPASSSSFQVWRHKVRTGSYIGENNFGVRVAVQKYTTSELDFVWNEIDYIPKDGTTASSLGAFRADVAPADAARQSHRFSFVYTFKFVAPFYTKFLPGDDDDPTMDDPEVVHDIQYLISVAPVRVDVVDYRTGAVVQSFDPKSYVSDYHAQTKSYDACAFAEANELQYDDPKCKKIEPAFVIKMYGSTRRD